MLLWAGQTVSAFGDAFFNLAIFWTVYTATGSAFKTAFVQLLWQLSTALFSPLAGVFADRLDRKGLLVGANLLSALAVFGAVLRPELAAQALLGAVPVLNGLGAFAAAARASVLPELVGPGLLVRAGGLFSVGGQVAVLSGSVLAGPVLAGAGLGVNNTFLAVFLRDLGGPAWTVGAAFAVAALGEVPLMAGMHRLIERFGLSVMVATGFLALPIRWTLYALLASPWPILPLQLLHSVTIAGLEVAGVVLVRTLTPPGWATTGQALYGAALMGLGPGIGTALAGTVYGWGGASTVFAASALAAGVGCLIVLRLPRAGPVGAASSPARASRTVRAGDGTPGG